MSCAGGPNVVSKLVAYVLTAVLAGLFGAPVVLGLQELIRRLQ